MFHTLSLSPSLFINVSTPSITSDEGSPARIRPCPLKQKSKPKPHSEDDVFVQPEGPSTPAQSASEYDIFYYSILVLVNDFIF